LKKKILIFVFDFDSHNIGFGHLMRSISLAEELKKNKIKCFFLDVFNKYNKYQINKTKLNYLNIKTVHLLKKKYFPIILIDTYKNLNKKIEKISGLFEKIILVDDFLKPNISKADILINYNLNIKKKDYDKDKFKNIFNGPEYLIFRKQLINLRRKPVKDSVLISFGKGSLTTTTVKLIKIILGELESHKSRYKIFFSHPKKEVLKKIKPNQELDLNFLDKKNSFLNVLSSSEFVITSPSTTFLECCYLKIPTILFQTSKNQVHNFLYAKRHVLFFAYNDIDDFKKNIKKNITYITSMRYLQVFNKLIKTMNLSGKKSLLIKKIINP